MQTQRSQSNQSPSSTDHGTFGEMDSGKNSFCRRFPRPSRQDILLLRITTPTFTDLRHASIVVVHHHKEFIIFLCKVYSVQVAIRSQLLPALRTDLTFWLSLIQIGKSYDYLDAIEAQADLRGFASGLFRFHLFKNPHSR